MRGEYDAPGKTHDLLVAGRQNDLLVRPIDAGEFLLAVAGSKSPSRGIAFRPDFAQK
jgi:hypothetical protein